MAIQLDSLGPEFPTFQQFQRMLREYEQDQLCAASVLPPVTRPAPPATSKWATPPYVREDVIVPQLPTQANVAAERMTLSYPAASNLRTTHVLHGATEIAGHTFQCGRCGKWFTGGTGAMCRG